MFKTPKKTVSSQSNLPHFPFLLWHLALKWQKIIHLCNNFRTQFPWDGAISLALLFFFLTVIRNCVKKNYKNNRRTENEKGLTWTLITIRATDKRLDCYNVIADWARRPNGSKLAEQAGPLADRSCMTSTRTDISICNVGFISEWRRYFSFVTSFLKVLVNFTQFNRDFNFE